MAQRQHDHIVIRPKLIDDVLINPGIGFTTFQRFNGDELNQEKSWTEGFPIRHEEFTDVIHNKNYPMTSIAYFRIYWRFLESQEGQFNWSLVEQALATARQRKQTLMFRVAPYGPNGDLDDVPDWYRDKVGEMTPAQKKHDRWRVDPEDPRYLKHFGGFIQAFGERYDGHPDLDSIDVAIVGPWGEGAGSDFLTQQTREALVDSYVDSFKATPLMMLLTDARTNQYGLSRADVGFRADCLGDMGGSWGNQGDWSHMNDYYPQQIILSGMRDAWKKAPISFEVCWVVQHWRDMGWDIDYIIDQSLKWHISTFNAKSSPIPEEWNAKVDRWMKKMGYRLALRKFTCPAAVRAGEELSFTSWWENLGVAPCYRPYPVALRFRSEQHTEVIRTAADVRQWLPGDSLFDSAVRIPAAMPPANYHIDLGILGLYSQEPAIQLAVEGRQTDGWYQLGLIDVRI